VIKASTKETGRGMEVERWWGPTFSNTFVGLERLFPIPTNPVPRGDLTWILGLLSFDSTNHHPHAMPTAQRKVILLYYRGVLRNIQSKSRAGCIRYPME